MNMTPGRSLQPLSFLTVMAMLALASAAVAQNSVWLDDLNLGLATQAWGAPQKNKSVGGQPLTLGGKKFERGFGTHAASRLMVNLKGQALKFTAFVGVDNECNDALASVKFIVHGDGRTLWESGVMKAGEAAKMCEVNLTGMKTLTLEVGDAGDGNGQDHADWADARFETTAGAVLETIGGAAEQGMRREIALTNPLLNFRDLLFIERGIFGMSHICYQYYGHNGRPGGGLYVLKDAFSEHPAKVDLLAGKTVTKGLMAGQSLAGGSFVSLDLSFDGKRIAFGWSPGGGKALEPQNRFRIFVCDLTGDNLIQLTGDVNADDIHPCWLPGDERIVFMSTRRGGFGRCHGMPMPICVMYSMKSDGSDLYCIDWHETNEWHPSIANDGMLVYTRWDYVDRDAVITHHFWKCWPDGRDPRSLHGNYPLPLSTIEPNSGPQGLNLRPMAEFNIRAIPGTTAKYVAVSGPHHGQAFGEVVLLDVAVPDDGMVSQVKKITSGPIYSDETGAYGTPWPLSENLFLCNHMAGLYLLDSMGNRELIYATPQTGDANDKNSLMRPLYPTPLRPRKLADGSDYPKVPPQTYAGARASLPDHQTATIAVMNVKIADTPLPPGIEPKWMRIVQLLPKTTTNADNPRIGYGTQSLARMSLGVVPIEKDGSVYCEAPVGKTLYFQLLDERGLAIHSMRSATYVHEGERLSCVGCHENKWENPPPSKGTPLALRRPPSKLQPEVAEGALPYNWARLVKPVLDAKCTGCHLREKKGPDMSYGSLGNYAFCFQGQQGNFTNPIVGGSRTTPGKFGARFARLTPFLTAKHYDVKLTPEECRRITLWLDLNSNELGAYTNVDEQRRGEVVWPELDVEPWNPLGLELLSKDATPPRGVTGVRAVPTQPATMVLTWNAATDAESGVDSYHIYRNGARVATVYGTRYTDLTVEKNQPCSYEVAPLNRAGLEGTRSAAITVSVPNNALSAAIP
ncbi:MAG: NPCBM/NEW2 domain-containing protein [Verrucomicrobia bacterium]|nr:NPCBM/NEW2 domain-containing protein [Verrucomicrobiota bacterium]